MIFPDPKTHCHNCFTSLTPANRNDPEAVYCTECWGAFPPWVPTCGGCLAPLAQDPDDRFTLSCKSCGMTKLTLKPIEQGPVPGEA